MNGIKMKDCKFYVDESARTVVCVIPNTKEMVQSFIDEHFSFNDIDFGWGWVNKALRMPHSFSGKAVCASEDEWNEAVESGEYTDWSIDLEDWEDAFWSVVREVSSLRTV